MISCYRDRRTWKSGKAIWTESGKTQNYKNVNSVNLWFCGVDYFAFNQFQIRNPRYPEGMWLSEIRNQLYPAGMSFFWLLDTWKWSLASGFWSLETGLWVTVSCDITIKLWTLCSLRLCGENWKFKIKYSKFWLFFYLPFRAITKVPESKIRNPKSALSRRDVIIRNPKFCSIRNQKSEIRNHFNPKSKLSRKDVIFLASGHLSLASGNWPLAQIRISHQILNPHFQTEVL